MTAPPSTPSYELTPLQQSAAALHELYLAYTSQGFNDQQALYLVGQVLHARTSAMRSGN